MTDDWQVDIPVRPGVYDHEARGDFMTHDDHDPTMDWDTCEVCSEALRRSFVIMADLDLGPNGSGELVDRLRRIVAGME